MTLLRPSEATRKLCPLTMQTEDPQPCEVDKCMAWAWYDLPYEMVLALDGARPKGLGYAKAGAARDGKTLWRKTICDSERRGFCRMVQKGDRDVCSCNMKQPRTLAIDEMDIDK